MIFKNFHNFGFIQDKLPNDLFNCLLKESLNFKTKKKFITGLTGDGTPNHYKIVNEENLKMFQPPNGNKHYFRSFENKMCAFINLENE